MVKTYRGRLPKPDAKGYYRPEVGGRRFNVGHKRDVSQGEALHRLNAVRQLFERQCDLDQIDIWANWLLPWAKRIAAGEALTFEVSNFAKNHDGQATEEARLVELLRSIGVNTQPDDPSTIANGERQIKQWVDDRINLAVANAVGSVLQEANLPPGLRERINAHGPADSANAETRSGARSLGPSW